MQKQRKYLLITLWVSGLSFIGAGFAGWGAYSFEDDVVKQIGKEQITKSEVAQKISNLKSVDQFKGVSEKELRDLALDYLTIEKSKKDFLRKNNFRVSDNEVLNMIKSLKYFEGKDGEFSKKVYFDLLKTNNFKPKEFETKIRDEIYREYVDGFVKSIKVSKGEVGLFSNLVNKRVDIKYGIEYIPFNEKVEESKIKAFYEKNKKNILEDPKYSIEYVEIDIVKSEVSEEKLKEFYKENQTMFNQKAFEKQIAQEKYDIYMTKNLALKEFIKIKKKASKNKIERVKVGLKNDVIEKSILLSMTEKKEWKKPILNNGKFIIARLLKKEEKQKSYEAAKKDMAQVISFKDNKEKIALKLSKEIDKKSLKKDIKDISYNTNLSYLLGDNQKVLDIKTDILNKEKGSTGFFYSDNMGGFVKYAINEIKYNKEIKPKDEKELKEMAKQLKINMYSNYINSYFKELYND